jgi:hypothetical protein
MDKSSIPILAEILELYYEPEEFTELASIFDVPFEHDVTWRGGRWSWLGVARQLVEKLDHGNHRLLIESLLEQLQQRNKTAIARTDWERREAHQYAEPKVRRLLAALDEAQIPREIVVAEVKPFTARAEVREFLELAQTEIFVVDPYVGLGTLDCLRLVHTPLRLLTGASSNSIEEGFDAQLQLFQAEGFQIEVRRNPKLHDRHIMFNERCWLVGSSLKDAGKKAFHTTEIIDARAEVVAALEAKWRDSSPYP